MSGERIPDVTAFESPPKRAINYSSISREQPLGRGGQAVVYRVDISDGPPDTIAYKEPLQSGTLSSEAIEAFLSEADSWELVDQRERNRSRWTKSEHIVGIIDTGDQLPWIAMEYMDGGGLDELLEANSDGINVDRALWIAECLAEGLKIAHANGIAHLDLKPDNVLFRSTGTGTWNVPKIADWGLARLLARETGTMEALSPQYAAPEQFEPDVYGEPDTLTDIYQLGAVLCAMLTGEPPYTGSRLSVMRSIVDGDGPPNLSERQNRIPATVESAVSQALAAEKNERYASISEFQQELKELRIGKRTKSTPRSSNTIDSSLHSDQSPDEDSQQHNRKTSNTSTANKESKLTLLSQKDKRYLESHEWTSTDDEIVRVGITDFGQDELGDIVSIDDLPSVGDTVTAGETFGVVESIKAVSDLYSPVTGEVVAVNDALSDDPELVNDEPFGDGWMLKVDADDPTGHDALLSAKEYAAQIE